MKGNVKFPIISRCCLCSSCFDVFLSSLFWHGLLSFPAQVVFWVILDGVCILLSTSGAKQRRLERKRQESPPRALGSRLHWLEGEAWSLGVLTPACSGWLVTATSAITTRLPGSGAWGTKRRAGSVFATLSLRLSFPFPLLYPEQKDFWGFRCLSWSRSEVPDTYLQVPDCLLV